MRFLILAVVALLVGCTSEPSPATGTWNLTMTPDLREFDCVYWGDLANTQVSTSFEVIDTSAGLIVDSGPSAPGTVEFYTITERDNGASIEVASFEDGVLEGHASLRSTGQTVTGAATLRIYAHNCEQAYNIMGYITQD